LGLLCLRRWALLAGLALPFAAAVAAALTLGGPAYRYNILFMPTLSELVPRDSAVRFTEVLVPNLFVYGFAAAGLYRLWRRRASGPGAGRERAVVLAAAFLVSTALGLVALGRVGSSRNMLFESFFLAAALSTAELTALLVGRRGPRGPAARRPWEKRLAAALLASMCALPAVNLLFPTLRLGVVRSNLVFGNGERYAQRREMSALLARLPKPVLIADEILSQPWHATAGRYPAFVMDGLVYEQAEKKGLLEGGGLVGKVRRGEFGAVVAAPNSAFAREAAEAGYEEVVPPPHLAVLTNASLGKMPVSVWKRPADGP
jgi:hypothetical protein